MPKLSVIIASTRPGRVGPFIATWFHEAAVRHGGFAVELVDLAEVNLPLLDEPNHPRLGQYEKEHTKRWSATVQAADAFVFVTPEYNYGTPPSLANALDFLYNEWNYKPAGFVSYGGISGGLRSVTMTRQILAALKVVPILEAVTIPFFAHHLKDGVFTPTEVQEKSAAAMLDELGRWSDALKTLRKPAAE